MGRANSTYGGEGGRPEGKRPRGGPANGWEVDIKMHLGGGEGMDCCDLAQGRLRWRAVVNTAMNFRVP